MVIYAHVFFSLVSHPTLLHSHPCVFKPEYCMCGFVSENVEGWRGQGRGGLSGPVQVIRSERRLRGRKKVPPPSLLRSFHSVPPLRTRPEVQIHCQSECEWMKGWMNGGGGWGRVRKGKRATCVKCACAWVYVVVSGHIYLPSSFF